MSKIKNPNSPWRKWDAMIQKDRKSLGARVHEMRRLHPDWTQKQVADALGCARSTVSSIVNLNGSYGRSIEAHK